MSNHDDGCANVIALLIVWFLFLCLGAAILQFVLAQVFSYHIGFWTLVGLLWVIRFVLNLIK